jgi:molecular chaperone HtpG
MSDTVTPPSPASSEALEYRTEVKQLLDILAHSLYTDRAIFLRELISNASDALNRIQFELLTNHEVVGAEHELAIHLRANAANRTLTISDSGIGMNRDELIENLGTIAHSGARAFLLNAGKGQAAQEEIIGQFGVGFYSVFMVADSVTVTSRSYRPEETAWRWSSTGDSSFTLEPAEKVTRGTAIHIHLKEDAAEFAQPWRLESIIRKHSNYVSFPIYVENVENSATVDQVDGADAGEAVQAETQEAPQPVNRRTALWRQSPSSVQPEEYTQFYQQLTLADDEPLLHLHIVTDAPVNLRALLFVPGSRERTQLHLRPEYGLTLYSRKVLIQEHNKELLPEHLRFVEGVVDSEDLPLNVSRETVQGNPLMRQMRRALTSRVHKEIKALADAEGEAAKYLRFWEEFGVFVKEGVVTDPASQEVLVDLLRFRSSRTGSDGWVSLKEYSERMAEGQEAIYYVLGGDLKSLAHSPHLDYFRAHDIEVLYLVDAIDGFVTTSLRDFAGKPLRNVDDANLKLPKGNEADESPKSAAAPVSSEQFDALVKRFLAVLGDRVKSVREAKLLVDSPCRLVSDEESYERDLERFRRLTEEDYVAPARVLELNRKHPIIANLALALEKNPSEPLLPAAIDQLYDNALLLEGLHANPVEMVEHIQALLAAAVAAKA